MSRIINPEAEGEAMKVYIAAGLFNDGELDYNLKVADEIKKAGHEVILPQNFTGSTEELYWQCLGGVVEADIVLAILNGSDVEGGTSFECGYAKGIGKKVIGLRNDKRENHVNGLNLMLAHGVSSLANTIEDAIGKIK